MVEVKLYSVQYTVQWNLDLRKISTCKFTYIRHLFSAPVHKSFLNQTLSDLTKTNGSFLNRDLPAVNTAVLWQRSGSSGFIRPLDAW